MVISGGVNIYPAEIEAVLHAVPGVHDCAVFGIPDAEFGEALMAVVEPLPGANIDVADIRTQLKNVARRLQGAETHRDRDQPAARGFRQNLQAPPARSLLGAGRAEDLTVTLGAPCSVREHGKQPRVLAVASIRTTLPADAVESPEMDWKKLFLFRNYVSSSLWVVPFIAIPIELATTRILHRLDEWLGWTFLDLGVAGAQGMLNAIITATLSFVVFTFGSMLVALQIASGQMTPRIIATILVRDNVIRYTTGLFIFTLLFAISALNRIQVSVFQLVAFVAACLGILCFAAFLFLIDYASRLLRPISIIGLVGKTGLAVIRSVYPDPSLGTNEKVRLRGKLGAPGRIVQYKGTSEIILGVNLNDLRALAERSKGVIELIPQVGDFIATDEPLFNLYGGAAAIDEADLRSTIVLGRERTLEQDPTFAIRIVADIALKALSMAINDPTTAVIAIDQLHRLLRSAGNRDLRTDEWLSPSGELRVIVRTPNWEDFVHLAFTEIRFCGAQNMQIARRLRAMIENLIETLPKRRHAALRQELMLLDREVERCFIHEEDRALARVGDSQGLGGASGRESLQ